MFKFSNEPSKFTRGQPVGDHYFRRYFNREKVRFSFTDGYDGCSNFICNQKGAFPVVLFYSDSPSVDSFVHVSKQNVFYEFTTNRYDRFGTMAIVYDFSVCDIVFNGVIILSFEKKNGKKDNARFRL